MVTFANVNLLLHSYTSDEGIIFENKKSYKEISFDETNFIIQKNRNDIKESTFTFQISINSDHIERYFRSYQKLQNVLAEITSVIIILTVISQFILNFFINLVFFIRVTCSVFEDKTIYKRIEKNIIGTDISNSILTTPTTEIPFNSNRNSKIKPFDNRQIFQKATSSSVIKLENIKKMRNDNCFTHLSCFDYINHFFLVKHHSIKV